MSTTGYTSAVPQESVWGFNPCGIFCGITMYHTSTTALLCGILWYIFFSVVFPMVFLVPHEYHRLHFCSTTGLCVVLHYPCGIFCGIMQYHRNTTGIPHDIFVRGLPPGRSRDPDSRQITWPGFPCLMHDFVSTLPSFSRAKLFLEYDAKMYFHYI